MSKELTPLEALHSFDHWIQVEFVDQFKIIETALKRLVIIDKLNEKHCKDTQKKLKAFEIIKEVFGLEVYKYERSYYIHSSCTLSQIKKDIFDLLKEVIKNG